MYTARVSPPPYLSVIVVVHLLVGVNVDVVKVDGCRSDGIGQHQKKDKDMEPRHF